MIADADHFWSWVDRATSPAGCWLWTGSKDTGGYGRARWPRRAVMAHRIAYELTRGRIPDGLQIDHLCRNRACVNPSHLEPVSARENTLRGLGPAALNARKVVCKRGHSLEGARLYRGSRYCRECTKAWARERDARERAARAAAGTYRAGPAVKTACVNGHAFTSSNTYLTPDGRRMCRECSRERNRQWRQRWA